MEPLSRITHDPAAMGGRPCIRGMRVTVGTVLGLLAAGDSAERILEAYPYLEAEDIRAALACAAATAEHIETNPDIMGGLPVIKGTRMPVQRAGGSAPG